MITYNQLGYNHYVNVYGLRGMAYKNSKSLCVLIESVFPCLFNNNNNNNNMYLKSSIQTSSIDYIKENIHITLNISSNIPIQ